MKKDDIFGCILYNCGLCFLLFLLFIALQKTKPMDECEENALKLRINNEMVLCNMSMEYNKVLVEGHHRAVNNIIVFNTG